MDKEASARLIINKLLEQAGWVLVNSDQIKANVDVENHLVDDEEKENSGFADYVLYGQDRKPVAVIEAKRSQIDPLDAKEQARIYAQQLGVRWVLLSNGEKHYQWNIEEGNPEEITRFPSQESLESNVSIKRDADSLISEVVGDDYVALTQNPIYRQDPRWQTADGRKQMIQTDKLRFLRDYQLDAIKSIQKAVSTGKKSFLFEMATGTGKTLTAAAIIKLFIKTQNASRVLFLVDRLELENQAFKNFRDYLKPDITTVIYKEHKDDWHRAEVVVTTVQSIMNDAKFQDIFNPNDFDLIISDEAHRAIGGDGASRRVFEYFSGYKLGLTATPKDYLKNLDTSKLAETDPRQLEKRTQLSTYEIFGCASGEPTFRYTLLDGVKDGYLINPYVLDCRTKVTTQLLSDEGYSVANNSDDSGDEEAIYHAGDFEKKFFSEDTNRKFVELFFRKALRDPISKEIGKTIVFCVSQNHARKITQLMNEYAYEYFNGLYNSDFAIQITSNIRDAQPFTIKFSNNNLSGNSRHLENYKTSKTRVCITVGMMTTGYDCPDLLNICLMRPIFSPQDFVQIKGRGTRKHIFNYSERLNGQEVEQNANKERFNLFDFFANCEFFENDYPYDETPQLPKIREKTVDGKNGLNGNIIVDYGFSPEEFAHNRKSADQIADIKEKQIGYEGMNIDSKLYNMLRDKANSAALKKSEIEKQAQDWWSEFSRQLTVTYDLMDEIKSLFDLVVFDEQIFQDLSNHEFSKYANMPELWNLLNSLGRTWIDRVVNFIKQKK